MVALYLQDFGTSSSGHELLFAQNLNEFLNFSKPKYVSDFVSILILFLRNFSSKRSTVYLCLVMNFFFFNSVKNLSPKPQSALTLLNSFVLFENIVVAKYLVF